MTNADSRFANMPVYLDDVQAETDLFEEVTNEIDDDTERAVRDAFPTGQISPMDHQLARDRLARMLASTLASDLPWIMEPGYYDAYRRGEMPAVQSPFWLNLLSQEKDFKDTQRDFRTLAKAEVSRLLGKKEPSEGMR